MKFQKWRQIQKNEVLILSDVFQMNQNVNGTFIQDHQQVVSTQKEILK